LDLVLTSMRSLFKKIIVLALTFEARAVLKKYKPKIIAVTGSVGKTSTKDALFDCLSPFLYVRKSQKSFNSEIGLPLTILGIPNAWNNPFVWVLNIVRGLLIVIVPQKYPKWLILEVGADRPGDIKNISAWLKPDVVVVTRFAKVPVHVEFFGTPERVIEEKSYLVKALKDEGILVLNADDEDVISLSHLRRTRPATFSLADHADIRASNYKIVYEKTALGPKPAGINFKVEYKGTAVPITLSGVLGRTHVYPVLAALLVGAENGLNLIKMAETLSTYHPTSGRMRILDGIKNTVIIDDTYNSSPVALAEALETLKECEVNGRKIVVLGDMMELGKHTVEEHQKAGRQLASFVNLLFTVGVRARHIAEGALDGGLSERSIFQFEDSRTAGNMLEHSLEPGDLILLKGSQSTRMEKAVEEIMLMPEDKEKLLVRQEEEWTKR